MKLNRVAVLLAATALTASAADLGGKWNLQSTWPDGPGMKPTGEIILDLKVDGNTVTGIAHIGSWPGDAPIVNGRVNGDRITFDATGHLPSSTGIPTCHFEATLIGDEMVLSMTMTRNPSAKGVFKFKGRKQSE